MLGNAKKKSKEMLRNAKKCVQQKVYKTEKNLTTTTSGRSELFIWRFCNGMQLNFFTYTIVFNGL